MKNLLKKRNSHIVINTISIILFVILMIILFNGNLMGNEADAFKSVVILACIGVVMVTSLNVVAGSMGECVLGHAGFMCIGAYISSIFISYVHTDIAIIDLVLSMLVGGASALIFGFIVGLPVLRLHGDYLAIVTLGFGEIVRICARNIIGAQPLGNIPLNTTMITALIFTIICVILIWTFMTGRHGRVIRAIRDDEIASEASGINVTFYKVLAFTFSAMFAGIAGTLYAQYLTVLEPKQFNLDVSVDYLVMVVFGGMGSYTGGIVAAVFLTFLKFFLIDFAQYRMIIYGILLVIIMIFRPGGLLGIKEMSIRDFLLWLCDIKLNINKMKLDRVLKAKNKILVKKEKISSLYEAKKYIFTMRDEAKSEFDKIENDYLLKQMKLDNKLENLEKKISLYDPIVNALSYNRDVEEIKFEIDIREKAVIKFENKITKLHNLALKDDKKIGKINEEIQYYNNKIEKTNTNIQILKTKYRKILEGGNINE